MALIGVNTDLNEVFSLSYRKDIIDIYTNSWGPRDTGATVSGPGPLTKLTLQNEATEVTH